jgi:carbonic anhydrase
MLWKVVCGRIELSSRRGIPAMRMAFIMMYGGWRIAAATMLVAAAMWIACSGAIAQAAGMPTKSVKASQLGPAKALARLMTGNGRFRDGEMLHPRQDRKQRESLTGSQSPFAVILSCSDSRVPPAIIFDQGLGDLFVVRGRQFSHARRP